MNSEIQIQNYLCQVSNWIDKAFEICGLENSDGLGTRLLRATMLDKTVCVSSSEGSWIVGDGDEVTEVDIQEKVQWWITNKWNQ